MTRPLTRATIVLRAGEHCSSRRPFEIRASIVTGGSHSRIMVWWYQEVGLSLRDPNSAAADMAADQVSGLVSGQRSDLAVGSAALDLSVFDLSAHGRSLISRATRGDECALSELWQQHRRWVAAIVLAHMPRSGGVELDDLLQEVAATVVGKVSGLRDEAAFKPWLRAVAMSIARTSGRKTKVRKAGWLKLVGFAGESASADAEADTGPGSARAELLAQGRKLMDLAADLPDGYREPLLLKCVQGMSYKEIGRVMGLPDTTIETRIARARRMLRERADKEVRSAEGVKHGA